MFVNNVVIIKSVQASELYTAAVYIILDEGALI